MPASQHLRDGIVVQFELDASEAEQIQLARLLSVDEYDRAHRFVTQELRKRFIVGRARLRLILSSLVGEKPEALRFRYNQYGKPFLDGCPEGSLAFNLSHSANFAVIAVRQNATVGIDLEIDDRKIDVSSLAPQVFQPKELHQWERGIEVDPRRRLLLAWVIKESVLKAIGVGLTGGMQAIPLPDDFFLDPNKTTYMQKILPNTACLAAEERTVDSVGEEQALSYQIRILDLNPRFFSALCCDQDPTSFACMPWENFRDRFRTN
jgi:phosphopantetheinyl transferase